MNTLKRMFSLCLCMSLFAFVFANTNHNETRDLQDLGWQATAKVRSLPEANQDLQKVGEVIKADNSIRNAVRPIGEASTDNQQNRNCDDCELDYTAYGSECCDTAWDEYGLDCATLEANYTWDCSGCACPGDIPCEDQGLITCEFGAIAGGNCAEDESGCLEEGACPAGTLADCSGDGDCCAESWVGDGFADCEDQAYGCDLTCYDNDGGDCDASTTDGGTTDATTTTTGGECPEGTLDDCSGDGDCCPESWIADGFGDCEDQAYGCDLTCYDNDGGDCDAGTTTATTGGTTGGTAACEDCEFDYTAYGSECCDTAWDEYGIDCATLEANYTWDCSGCNCPGDAPSCEEQGLVTCWDGSCVESADQCPEEPVVEGPDGVCVSGSILYDYPAVTVTWAIEVVCGDGICNGDETYENCPEDCNAPGECDEGFVVDCADLDCCPESWIGDGFADCEDQAYGCDLTCYDNDGGDCDASTTDGGTTDATTTTTGGECPEGTLDDCSGDGDCCPESWVGDGFGDCEDQAYGCDLTCYDNDGGDCDASTTTATTGGTTGGTAACEDCEFDFTAYGSECCDTAWDEYGIDCATLEANYTWDCSGCACPGDIPCEDQGLITCEFGAIAGGNCAEDESGCLEEGACPAGTLADCSGDGDCCAESWVGDGFGDCEDQAYGCDLTCYDNDGGDCDATDGRAVSDGFKSIAQSLKSGRVVNTSLTKQEVLAIKEGVITNSGTAVRIGEVIFANESREVAASIDLTVLEGVNVGFEGNWLIDPSLGEFTVYGFDATDLVMASIQFCDGTVCSDAVISDPVFAGSEDQWCGEGAGCENAMGDVNNDGTVNVLDIVNIVNHILGASELVDCDAEAADYNMDGTVNVLDIVNIVNMILGGKSADATSATLTKTASVLSISADGYIGGVQMTLSHGADFAIDITDNALVADYKTDGNQTILVVVAPEGEDLFTYSGDFEIVDMIVANSHSEVSVGQPTVFALGSAYPNPFNPTTSLSLSLPESGYVSVKVYNMMGQEIATLADGLMDASAYTLTWDASDASSGMYFVRAEYAGNIATQKLMLLK